MKSITIKGSQRESVGKAATKALRNAGKVPCVVYGGDEPIHFSAEEKDFNPLVYTPNVHTVVIEMEGGGKVSAIMQDIQFHPVNDRILHMDFYQIFDDKEITMDIPVQTVGDARGIRSGGVLLVTSRRLKVKALSQDLPDFIECDITDLRIGDKLYVRDIQGDKYKIMLSDDTVVAQVRTSRLAIPEPEEDEEDEDEEGEEGEEGTEARESDGGDAKEGGDKAEGGSEGGDKKDEA